MSITARRALAIRTGIRIARLNYPRFHPSRPDLTLAARMAYENECANIDARLDNLAAELARWTVLDRQTARKLLIDTRTALDRGTFGVDNARAWPVLAAALREVWRR